MWRHDSLLRCIYNFFLPPCLKNSCKLFIDYPELGLQSPSELFQTLRPDIVIQNENEMTAIEQYATKPIPQSLEIINKLVTGIFNRTYVNPVRNLQQHTLKLQL